MRKMVAVAGVVALSLLLFLGGGSVSATSVNFSNMWVGSITPGSGHVGVDITWPGNHPFTGAAMAYNPCHQYKNQAETQTFQDSNYGGCVMSNSGVNSYYKVHSYTPSGTSFPYGIFINNQDTNFCTTATWCPNPTAQTVSHGWANIISDIIMEVYPYNANGQYDPLTSTVGGVRLGVNNFPTYANGGRYSTQVGNIALPQLGNSGVGKLNGFVTYNGAPIANERFAYDMFQQGSTMATSTGHPVTGFASDLSNADGYYSSGAVPFGTYKIYITDRTVNKKYEINGVAVSSTGDRIDFDLAQPCFGFTGQCVLSK